MASIVDAALRVKGDPSMLIDPLIVHHACRACKHTWRERTLDPVRTLEAFTLQIAHGNTAISHVVRLCGGSFVESAYCAARERLPVEVCRALLRAATEKLRGTPRSEAGVGEVGSEAVVGAWKGHNTYTTDGSGCDMPDTKALQEYFGQSPAQKQGCGFPIANCLVLFDAASLMIVDVIVSPFGTRDISKMQDLHTHLRPGDILLGDRGFCGYSHIALLQQKEMHAVFRAHHSRALPFPALPGPREHSRSERPTLVEMISSDDQVIEIVKPHNRTPWLSSEQFAAIPGKITVRVLRYRVEERGIRSREIVLMTTLLDKVKYPAADIAELYRARWQVEVNLRNLKQTLGMNSLRCKTVDGVTREVLMFALVYNAVCAVMGVAAARQNAPIKRVSFIDALRWLQVSMHEKSKAAIKLNPRRAKPTHPRMLKRRLRYPKLFIPRTQWQAKLLTATLK